jgi:phosphoribosylanthranilate isomerase
MKPLVKICGITNKDDAIISMEYGADILGFNFYDKSPRYIEPQVAGNIISDLKKDFEFESAGIFVNHNKEYVDNIVRVAGIDILQFHGDESPDLLLKFNRKTIKAFRIRDKSDISECYKYNTDFYLLDAFSKSTYGGTGESFDWDILADIDFRDRLFLSGGISSRNISDARKKINPYAVDLCSSIEKKPGIKDHNKIKEFFSAFNQD